jgi:hypothetical protein
MRNRQSSARWYLFALDGLIAADHNNGGAVFASTAFRKIDRDPG